jgi:virginiamycin B lyase
VLALLLAGVSCHGSSDTPHPSPAVSDGPNMPAAVPVPQRTVELDAAHDGDVTSWDLGRFAGPSDVIVADDGSIWTAEQNQGLIGSFDPSTATYTTYSVFQAWDNASTYQVTQGTDGAIWFSSYPNDVFGRVFPDGHGNAYLGLSTTTGGIATAADGSIWIGAGEAHALIRVFPGGDLDDKVLPPTNGSPAYPRDLAANLQGIWFTLPANDAIGIVQNGGAVATYDAPPGSQPYSVASDPDGVSVWATLGGTPSIAHVLADGSVDVVPVEGLHLDTQLRGIAVAPDGTIWLTQNGDEVLHVRPDGSTIAVVRLPEPAPTAGAVAVASDGTAWVVSSDASMLVRIDGGAP